MTQAAIIQHITESFAGVEVATVNGDSYFFYDPQRKFPFATLVTSNAHDPASDLERPGVFRLNIGVGSNTYRSMFGPQPPFPRDGGIVNTGHDFTALDRILPHPVEATLETVKRLLAEAYEIDVKKYANRKARGGP